MTPFFYSLRSINGEFVEMVPLLEQRLQDQRIVQSGRTWQQFKLIQEGFVDSPGIKLFYYNGTIEILMPGREHEMFSAFIALL